MPPQARPRTLQCWLNPTRNSDIKSASTQDWKQRQTTRAAVQVGIEKLLDGGLPEDAYDRAIFARKTAAVFEHVFSAYQGDGKSVYEAA